MIIGGDSERKGLGFTNVMSEKQKEETAKRQVICSTTLEPLTDNESYLKYA